MKLVWHLRRVRGTKKPELSLLKDLKKPPRLKKLMKQGMTPMKTKRNLVMETVRNPKQSYQIIK